MVLKLTSFGSTPPSAMMDQVRPMVPWMLKWRFLSRSMSVRRWGFVMEWTGVSGVGMPSNVKRVVASFLGTRCLSAFLMSLFFCVSNTSRMC